MTVNPRLELWAKGPETNQPYPLVCHLLDTATVAGVLWRLWVRPGLRELVEDELGGNAEKIVMLVAGLHDLGKANPVFQLQQASRRKYPWQDILREELDSLGYPHVRMAFQRADAPSIRRHERVSAAHLAGDLSLANHLTSESLAAVAALAHHGAFAWSSGREVKLYTRFAMGEWGVARRDLIEVLQDACGITLEDLPDASPVTAVLLSGLVVLADRLASQEETVNGGLGGAATESLDPKNGSAWIRTRTEFAEGLVRSQLGIYQGFDNPQREILGEFQPRGAQRLAGSAGDGLWAVMTATGSGKTEGSLLRHGQRDEAVTFLLPTQATTNAMMRRMQSIFTETGNVAALAHGDAWLEDFYIREESSSVEDSEANRGRGGLFPREFVASRASRLLAPVTVATIDQALMAALPLKWTHLRLLALANSHIIIDEVHTLDEYQARLLEPLLWWLGRTKTRVTLLSATLTQRHRDQYVRAYTDSKVEVADSVAFPSVVSVPLSEGDATSMTPLPMDSYKISLETDETDDPVANHYLWAKRMISHNPHARLGIVVNTIDRAQQIARLLQDDRVPLIVLHSRMSLKHRQDNAQQLEQLIGRKGVGEGLIVVGTQAIEASLDIDLDAMSSDLAPSASLVQRAGRVWRHQDECRAARLPGVQALPLRVVKSSEEGGHLPYFEAELMRTWRFLQARTCLQVPGDLQAFIEQGSVTLDEIDEVTEKEFDATLDELSSKAVKGQTAVSVAIDLKNTLRQHARVGDLGRLTESSKVSPDKDSEFPSTRFRDRVSQRVLVVGPDAELIPGGWSGTFEDLKGIEKKDRNSVRQMLAGVITVGGNRQVKALLETMSPVENIPALLGVIVGELPKGFVYDPTVGLMWEKAQ